jgi:hypothetical protein
MAAITSGDIPSVDGEGRPAPNGSRIVESLAIDSAGKALVAVIQEAWIGGVSTRRIDDLVHAMGLSGISKSQSRSCAMRLTSGCTPFSTGRSLVSGLSVARTRAGPPIRYRYKPVPTP